jgi:hypothetical protein
MEVQMGASYYAVNKEGSRGMLRIQPMPSNKLSVEEAASPMLKKYSLFFQGRPFNSLTGQRQAE